MTKPTLTGCKVERKVIEQLVIVGPTEQSKAVMNELFDAGFRMIQQGPYTNRDMFPSCDVTRFLYHAEREMTP